MRGMMAKAMETDQFMKHVVTTINRQLKLWNDGYEISLLQDLLGQNFYKIVVKIEDKVLQINLQCTDVEHLQAKWPYALDQHIWRRLANKGLVIETSNGNYLEYCAI